MISQKQMRNAKRIVELDQEFGHLQYNEHGQTVRGILNLSIPCAILVVADVVTGVRDTFDGINDQAVDDVARYCLASVERLERIHGDGWWTTKSKDMGLR